VTATNQRYAMNGLTTTMSEKTRSGQAPKIMGEVESQMVTLACSEPPERYARWTLRLLHNELVRLEVADSLCRSRTKEAVIPPRP
jgi:hypothetical protein